MDCIRLNDMAFYGYHGVLPEERTLGQRFLVDIEMRVDLRRAGETDALADTVNYADVYGLVRDIVTGTPHQLIESVAERIAGHILRGHGSVESVVVRIRKPEVPLPGAILSSSEVRIERARGESP